MDMLRESVDGIGREEDGLYTGREEGIYKVAYITFPVYGPIRS